MSFPENEPERLCHASTRGFTLNGLTVRQLGKMRAEDVHRRMLPVRKAIDAALGLVLPVHHKDRLAFQKAARGIMEAGGISMREIRWVTCFLDDKGLGECRWPKEDP